MPLSLTLTKRNEVVLDTSDGPVTVVLSWVDRGTARVRIDAPLTINIRRTPRCDQTTPQYGPTTDETLDGTPTSAS